MFELSVAGKYLIPKRKQLSVSLIALMSVGVISLVVWLVLVFLSVTQGIEKNWLEKLTTLNAPLRITPTDSYFSSYYYQVDSISENSGYSYKTIGEKLKTACSDPYNPEVDQQIPPQWGYADRKSGQALKDPVKEAFQVLNSLKREVPGLAFQEYEMGGALLRVEMVRPQAHGSESRRFLTQASFIASFPDQNPALEKLLTPASTKPAFKSHKQREAGILLPKGFQENGVQIGDRGYLSYSSATASALQEHREPISVSGFYDPGIMSIGNKCLLVPQEVVHAINSSSSAYAIDPALANGIQVWFKDLNQAQEIKLQLVKAFKKAGIDSYWKIATFKEYDFAKDLLEQFQSDKYLFALIGVLVLAVACCNIISLLVLLVNDKKKEIGILRSMGATSTSIAAIFAVCGISMGLVSCLVGTVAAWATLHNIDAVVGLLSFVQGHEAFNAAFYGKSLPNTLSSDALLFVLIATPLISLCAGLIPAFKACRLKPSAILRSE